MLKKPLFWETFILFFIVGGLNALATIYHLYWRIAEFDSVVHFFGGATLSMFFLWLYFYSGFFSPTQRTLGKFLLISVVGSMVIAVSWESYELLLGESVMQKAQYPYDTSLDFIMDTLGMLASCFYAYIREIES